MNVERIYTRNVARILGSASLGDAARLMSERNVGLLIVTGDGSEEFQAVGVITDRDLVTDGLAQGLGPEEATVRDLMSWHLQTVSAGADVHEALSWMSEARCRRLAVTGDDGRIVGVLSVDDLVDGIAADLSTLATAMRVGSETGSMASDNSAVPS